jgi:Protein kinase domain
MNLNPEGPFPQTFGPFYSVERYVGRGAFGEVYRAWDELRDGVVALKVLKAEHAHDPATREALFAEARVARRSHDRLSNLARMTGEGPNGYESIVRVIDSNEWEGQPYVAMEYVEGDSLEKLAGNGGLCGDTGAAVLIAWHLARALAGVHECGYLHRDVKPGNAVRQPGGTPVLLDFGLAIPLGTPVREFGGTPGYASPEQFLPTGDALTPEADVYALGATLYELLTGELPFDGDFNTLRWEVLNQPPGPPSARCRAVNKSLDAICLKALAKEPADRFRTMTEFANVLKAWLDDRGAGRVPPPPPVGGVPMTAAAPSRPRVPRAAIRYAFAGHGSVAPPRLDGTNRLFLDVGNDLRPGVVDHHQIVSAGGSTAGLVPKCLAYIDGAVAPGGADEFTIVLHHDPDLDCVASAWLAAHYLAEGGLPAAHEQLVAFVDRVDAGQTVLTTAKPFSLYSAQRVLQARPKTDAEVERWTAAVQAGLGLLDYVMGRVRGGEAIDDVDAFAAPTFTPGDRESVAEDLQRYAAKLADRQSAARVANLSLPRDGGGRAQVDALLIRDVQNVTDLARCRFFKDWARGDVRNSPRRVGFVALSVFHPEEAGRPRRCILSVTPGQGVALPGLGARLDAAESDRRGKRYGKDDRVIDPATGLALDPRPGYDNADPWYDGRAHGYTIVDSPRAGTVLTADEIEQIFLDYGAGEARPLAAVQ